VRLAQLLALFADAGCERLYAKPLAENDNSKNQVYFGPGFEALNLFPTEEIVSDSSTKNPIFKAKLDFGWLLTNGEIAKAPGSQLILYPQYPEVRFSGFLQGCSDRPSELMASRQKGRILFLGVTAQRQVVGLVVGSHSRIAVEFRVEYTAPTIGVFIEVPLPRFLGEEMARRRLLEELRRIHRKGWITSKQLSGDGSLARCEAPQCGGFTLEAELGIPKNSKSEPDFHGWEVKQHKVDNFERGTAGAITLMTPEPTGGYYKEQGAEAFVRTFGYADKRGRLDRLNFGGVHRAGVRQSLTGLTMTLVGYDGAEGVITNAAGAVALINDSGVTAASWTFAGLLKHWTRKHSKCVYVPSQRRTEPHWQYRYGDKVRLAMRTDFLRFLKAMAEGLVSYDPGIKIEGAASMSPAVKRRSQFRIASRNVPALYEMVESVQL
jgi:hypothetical protein